MPLFRGSSRFESLILSHHSKFTCECDKQDIHDDDDDDDDDAMSRLSSSSLLLSIQVLEGAYS